MNKINNLLLIILLAFFAFPASAQGGDPVHFSVRQKQVSPTEVDVIFSGKIIPGWHVYSTGLPSGGPTSATLTTENAEGAKEQGQLQAKGKEISNYDKVFNMKLRYFENTVTFVQRYRITGKTYKIAGFLEYGACNDQSCTPPTSVEFSFSGNGAEEVAESSKEAIKEKEEPAGTQTESMPAVVSAVKDSVGTDSASVVAAAAETSTAGNDLWKPVVKELQALNGNENGNDSSWWYILAMGFAGGLLALFTPCVWPIIPMTVSFFLKRSQDKARGIRDAVTYGISIIVIYLTLGLAITALFGASSLNALSTNAVFNILFFLLLVVFALSFFGWFEIRLPDRWGNAVDSKASSTGGALSIFLMAFTLALVSFSCTGPIIGFLLVQVSTSGSIAGPAVGMFGFALALALPFTLFALFPAWLKQAPKSGSWMNTIKVVLGFIELAFALKFFSVADLAYGWHLLDREVFLSIWIVLFGLLGMYLIGKLKFPHDDPGQTSMPVPCIILGMASLAFAMYMIPGLWGAPVKAVSAFAPPVNTQDFNLNKNEVHAHFDNYEEGMAAAAAQGKPVLIDFTGFGCVNCRKMEAAVWTDPQVADKLTKDYVLISLYVDDKKPLPEPTEIEENGRKRKLRTVGDKWSYLQRYKFGTNAQPFYVALDNDGTPLGKSYSYDEDVRKYLEFLNQGLENYRKGTDK